MLFLKKQFPANVDNLLSLYKVRTVNVTVFGVCVVNLNRSNFLPLFEHNVKKTTTAAQRKKHLPRKCYRIAQAASQVKAVNVDVPERVKTG